MLVLKGKAIKRVSSQRFQTLIVKLLTIVVPVEDTSDSETALNEDTSLSEAVEKIKRIETPKLVPPPKFKLILYI